MKYLFALAQNADLAKIWQMINDRIKWMDDHQIEQWNVVNYCEVFPLAYYEHAIREKRLYVLKRANDSETVAAAVLLEDDELWNDGESAYYIHNFVTDIHASGVGHVFLDECDRLARLNGKRFIRLDCARSNDSLNQYYARQGFILKGTCVDGPYIGNKREKEIQASASACRP